MIYGVIGSGFGVYGYVPPIIDKYNQVCLLEKSQSICLAREDIVQVYKRILWVKDLTELLSSVSALVIATPPNNQFKLINSLNLNLPSNIQRIILEKPLAENAQNSLLALKFLNSQKDLAYRISFIFLYFEWFHALQETVRSSTDKAISIEWNFSAHHIKNNLSTWKASHSQGGGVLRFYAIHFLPLLVTMGFTDIKDSTLFFLEKDVPTHWVANFKNKYQQSLSISVNINSKKEYFHIRVAEDLLYSSKTAIPEKESQYADNRCQYLSAVLASFDNDDIFYKELYEKTSLLQERVEESSLKIFC